MLLARVLDVRNIALVFLMAVLTSAVTAGLWPAIFASVISALAFNFFFLEPLYTLTISDPESVVALVFFFCVAIIASNLTVRVQRQAVAARQRARTTEDLYLFSKKLAGTGTLDDVLWATAFQIASMLKLRVVLLLPENGSIAVRAGYPPDDTLAEADIAAARWAWEHNRAAGRGADTLPGAKRLYIPLKTGRTAVGVVGLDNDKEGPLLTPEQQRLLDALADQAAVAIERIQLVADVDRAKLAAEADRLRSALLTSISHDLKTPLAAIMGAAGTLKEFSQALPEKDRGELLSTMIDESERLNRFIANLLDMTKIESGAMEPNYALHYVGDIVGTALQRAKKITAEHTVGTDIPSDLPMLQARSRPLRAGAFQPARQRRQICPEGLEHPHPGMDGQRLRAAAGHGRGAGHPAGRPGAHLRHLLPRAQRRPCPCRHRARPVDLPGLRRGDGRNHLGGEQDRPFRRGLHDQDAGADRNSWSGRADMTNSGVKILVVDDEPPIRKLLRVGLGSQGYTVSEAGNAKAAMELVGTERPDLVLLDLGLPDIGGHEVAQ